MSEIHSVLFDLDDTLYPEMDFVRSGFRTVARFLSSRLSVPGEEVFRRLMAFLEREGRGGVFDSTLSSFGADLELVRVCVHVYRSHRPDVALFEDALPTLRRLREARVRLGIVTDGMGAVQRAKVDALGLEPLVDAVVLSDVLGQGSGKPAGDAYRVALDLLGARPEETAYVGDNAAKDFLWPNAAGMRTIRLRRGPEPDHPAGQTPEHRARHEVGGLLEILPVLGR